MQVFVIINNVGIMINADANAKNWLTKGYVIKNLFGIQVIVNVGVTNCWRIFRLSKLQV